ncbi:hypothetical protein PFL02_06650 [Pseudomonas fluorescens]|nr:hypothetical protein PFL02_06650 [Pseudomonas fluorescens]
MGIDPRQAFTVRLHRVGQGIEQSTPFLLTQSIPSGKGRLRRIHRSIDILSVTVMNSRQALSGGRIQGGQWLFVTTLKYTVNQRTIDFV